MAAPDAPSNIQTLVAQNFIETTLIGNLAAAAVEVPCLDASLFGSPSSGDNEYNCVFVSTQELFRVTSRAGNVLTVTREQEGTTAAVSTQDGEVIQIVLTAQYYSDQVAKTEMLQRFLLRSLGWSATGYGIVNTGNPTTEMWHTTQSASPDLNVLVKPGMGVTENEAVETVANETIGPITAPSGDNRIDLLQYTLGTGLNIKTGAEAGSPSPPSVDSNSIPIYDLGQAGNYLTVGMGQIVNAMLNDRRDGST